MGTERPTKIKRETPEIHSAFKIAHLKSPSPLNQAPDQTPSKPSVKFNFHIPKHSAYVQSQCRAGSQSAQIVLPRSKDTPQAQSEKREPIYVESSARSNFVKDKHTIQSSKVPSSQTKCIRGKSSSQAQHEINLARRCGSTSSQKSIAIQSSSRSNFVQDIRPNQTSKFSNKRHTWNKSKFSTQGITNSNGRRDS